VAQWARGQRRTAGSVYERVRSRASDELGYDVLSSPGQWWIKQCKQVRPQLLSADELRPPSQEASNAPDDEQNPTTPDRGRPMTDHNTGDMPELDEQSKAKRTRRAEPISKRVGRTGA